MLSAGGLLSTSTQAVRRQGWLIVPLAIAQALGQLIGVVPGLLFVALALSAGYGLGATDPIAAAITGLPTAVGNAGNWMLTFGGVVLVTVGAWLLLTIIQAGILKMLGEQVGRPESVDDAAFSDGLMESATRALLTGALATVFWFFVVACLFGMLASGVTVFSTHLGVLAALMMTIATAFVITSPAILAGLQTGFTRAVLLGEGSVQALGSGLLLAWRRGGALLPVWYLLAFVQVAIAFAIAAVGASITALSGPDVWVLFLGPRAFVWIAGLVLASIVELVRLGAYAALVSEDAGSLPPEREPVLRAIPVAEEVPSLPEPIET